MSDQLNIHLFTKRYGRSGDGKIGHLDNCKAAEWEPDIPICTCGLLYDLKHLDIPQDLYDSYFNDTWGQDEWLKERLEDIERIKKIQSMFSSGAESL